eukprot:3182835-Prymnesium_polylepis.1
MCGRPCRCSKGQAASRCGMDGGSARPAPPARGPDIRDTSCMCSDMRDGCVGPAKDPKVARVYRSPSAALQSRRF